MFASSLLLSLWSAAIGQTPLAEAAPVPKPTQQTSIDLKVFPLPPDIVFRQITVNVDGTTEPSTGQPAGAADEKLVYSNTQGQLAVEIGANNRIADGLTLAVGPNCRLRRIEFPVIGRVDPAGIGGPYTVNPYFSPGG